jgi:hypothetical protein
MARRHLVIGLARYWRCYSLLLIASVLSFLLVYIGQNDPNLDNLFPYFRFGSKYYYMYANGAADEMKNLMERTNLDYEYEHVNSRACMLDAGSLAGSDASSSNGKLSDLYMSFASSQLNLNIDDDYALLNNDNSNENTNKENKQNNELKRVLIKSQESSVDYLLLSIGQAFNFKHRHAARQTWSKYLTKSGRSRLLFFVGNPEYFFDKGAVLNSSATSFVEQQQQQQDRARLSQEIKDNGDIVQVNMPDHENYTSTKTLIALRWTLTYCSMAKHVFVLSDSAVLNFNSFYSLIQTTNSTQSTMFNDSYIYGMCNYTDEKFATALRLFFSDLYQRQKSYLQSLLANHKKGSAISNKEKREEAPAPPNTPNIIRSGMLNKIANDSRPKETPPVASRLINTISDNSGARKQTEHYQGQYCSNLGWLLTINGAKRLWLTALRTNYMMRISPAYLNGYLAFKANLKHANLFEYHDSTPVKMNCLNVFETKPSYLLCAENFTIAHRYTNYIATWNSPTYNQFLFSKL